VPRRSLVRERADDAYLLRQWKSWHDVQREEAVTGPHGALVAQLLEILRGLTLHDGAKLVRFIRVQDWTAVDYDVRLICLHEINQTIMKLRTKAGLPEFDDGFPPERATAFQIIKQMIGKQPPD